MKYRRLTQEQLEALHHEFALFLATQQITADQWQQIKKEKPSMAEEEIDIFSDCVWDRVLQRVHYLEKREPQWMFLFKCESQHIEFIGVKSIYEPVDFSTSESLLWLETHLKDDGIEIFTGQKAYEQPRNQEIFNLIEKGNNICEGTVFEWLNNALR